METTLEKANIVVKALEMMADFSTPGKLGLGWFV